ncbi:MAG: adenylate/guanylate cyclase domain-containing protein [Proteobacteria bacterium]|nr:adenylate/guanylate cyclase domain-containing protein [Pseudomonadota bacterium]
MSEEPVRRRLAAVVSADVVDYTLHMARDEPGTLRAIRALRDLAREIVAEGSGRVVDAVGDALLAEFPSVVNATSAAVAVNRRLAADDASDREVLTLRIGIHVGEVLEDAEGQLYGEAVNVAARIMALGGSGDILLSAAAQTHLGRRAGVETRFVGEYEVKNVSSAIEVHRVFDPTTDAENTAGPERLAPIREPTQLERVSGLPAIAVLPFDNMSSEPDQDYLADGLVEDLITALACSRWFAVIARNSTFVYKGRAVSIREASRELGARYIVEGSVRRVGSRVRVTGQLIDGTTGAHVWAERYDREVADLFDLQDELTQALTGALIPSVQGAERARAMAKPAHNLDAWESLHRGIWHLGIDTLEDHEQARRWFAHATRLAPRWGLPYAAQAWSRVLDITYEFAEDVVKSLSEGFRCAERAVALSPDDVEARNALGWISAFARRYDDARKAFERGIDLNPSAAGCHHGVGFVLSMCDRPEEALKPLRHAVLLSPQDPQLDFRRGHLGQALFQLGRYDEAIDEVRASLELRHAYGFAYLLAAALGMAGRLEEGREVVAEAQGRFPDNRVEGLRNFLSPDLYALHLEGLSRL